MSRDLFALLKQIIDLPPTTQKLVLTLVRDDIVRAECTFVVENNGAIDVALLDSRAKEYAPALVTEHYEFVKISPVVNICDLHAGVTEEQLRSAIKAASDATLATVLAHQRRTQ